MTCVTRGALVLERQDAGSLLRIRLRSAADLGTRARPVIERGSDVADRAFIGLMLAGLRERVALP